MMNDVSALQKAALQEHYRSPDTGHTLVPSRQPYMSKHFASRHVCFYKSGDAQFNGLPVVINNRTFKTFEALLDNLSKRVPLPFGVRTITTPRGHTVVRSLDQLHHGHSYICSDKRTVKPIDLEQARRKPPPWYHARPVSNRRLRGRQSPGPINTRQNKHAAFLRSPKRLVVFRNGDPEVKHTLLLQKRTTHSFEALLDYISEVMCFPVRRLHTPDGRRVEGLPSLILCSGVLVAAGREPFRKGNYDVQKPFAPTWLPAKSVGRLQPVTRKKKSLTSSTKSHPFSPSSEHYVVNQLRSSFAHDPSGSVEIETCHQRESVAETDTVTCMDGDTDEYICMPTDDNIEKYFRVNQDGSMTVEMKVRLSIKEEETVHWATTLSRQSVSNLNKLDSDPGAVLAVKITPEVDTDASAIQNHPDEYCNISINECSEALCEEIKKGQPEEMTRINEPLQLLSEQKLPPVENNSQDIVQRTDTFREASNDQEHCLVKQCNNHPVPKPRSTGTSQLQASTYKYAEILQLQDNGQETVFHIYKHKDCQKSFPANTELYGHQIHICDTAFSPSSDTVHSSSKYLESDPRPVSGYDSFQTLEYLLPPLEVQTSCERNNSAEIKNKKSKTHSALTESSKVSAHRTSSTENTSKKRKRVRVIVKKSHIFYIVTGGKRRKANKIDILKEIKKIRAAILNQAGDMRGVAERYNAESVKKLSKGKKKNPPVSYKSVSSALHKTFQMQIQSKEKVSVNEQCNNEKNPAKAHIGELGESLTLQNKHLLNISTNKCILTRQTSMQDGQEMHEQNTQELKESTSLPDLHYSSDLNDYVEQKSEAKPLPYQEQVPAFKSAQELEITHEISGTRQESKKNVTPPIPVDSTRRNMPKMSGIKLSSAQERFLSHINIPVQSIPVPMTLSLKQNHGKIMASENNSSPDEASFCKNIAHNILKENMQLSRSISLNKAQTASCVVSNNNLVTCENESLKQELIKLPQYVKKDENTDEPLGNTLGCANKYVKPASLTKDRSLELSLSSRHAIEEIPKNNTLSKASLFNNQCMEKTVVSKNATFYKKPKPGHSGLMKGHQSRVTQGLLGSCENNIHTSLNPLSENVIAVFPTEKSCTVKMAVRPNMSHVLDELCHSIHSLSAATQHKHHSCLEKSHSMPDFSSHLASTFGSSTRVLLAFLSVMTLKDGLENLNALRQAGNSLSNPEALLMLQSLKEMAGVKDAKQLRASLNDLHKSASNQLLQSWKGFQQLTNTSMSSTRGVSSTEEEAIQGLEELAALHTEVQESSASNLVERSDELCESLPEEKVNGHTELGLREETVQYPDDVLDDINTYVKFVIEKAFYAHSNSEVFMAHSLLSTEKEIKVVTHEQEISSCPKEGTQQTDCIPDSNICENIFEEKQQRNEETDKRHKGEQDIYAKQEINNEIKDIELCEQTGVIQERIISQNNNDKEENYIMETDDKYFHPLYSNKGMKEVKDLGDASETSNGKITDVYPQLSERSKSKVDLTTSEEEKFSLEEGSCVEGHMNLSEDHGGGTEKNLQIDPARSQQEKCSMIESQAKLQGERLVNQAHDKTDSAKRNTGHPETQTSLLAVCQGYGTRPQTEELFSEVQQVGVKLPECYTVHQENIDHQTKPSSKHAEIKTVQSKKKNSFVAELINHIETCTQRPSSEPEKSAHRFMGHTEGSDPDDVNNVSGKPIDTTSEAHTLAFSYDSRSSSLAQEPERSIQGNRVKFIRDMFLAKSQTRSQNRQRQLNSRNSDLSDSQPESTDSGGNCSQETSSEEDDTSRLSIAKGFVRRTIERLYGNGNPSSVGADQMRSPSAMKAKQREGPGRTHVSSLASNHEAHTRVMTDLSYFSATNASNIFNASDGCATLNEQAGPKAANLINKGHWLLPGNQICESSPKLQEGSRKEKTDRTISVDPEQHSKQEDSLHGTRTATEPEKRPGSSRSKFTYFNLPNASDSELESEEKRAVKVDPATQVDETVTEGNNCLPAFRTPGLKKAGNKVHPLIEATAPIVITQPVKGQRAHTGIIKQSAEPDALEMMFVFCGQHCPIL